MSDHYIDQVFADGGLFAKALEGYEQRPEQIQLAHVIDEGFCAGKHVLAEAPCGTGKSLAYGVPAIAHACHNQKRCVITTANIQLQEQLFYKDFPFLQRVLPFKFSFALMKGKNNYLCLDRISEGELDGSFNRLRAKPYLRKQMSQLLEWARETETGDKTELTPAPADEVWRAFSVTAEDCKAEQCTRKDECWAKLARAIAMDAHVVITNYHLLFAHLAVRRQTGVDLVLPPFEHLVMDEAHEAAEIARSFMGFSLSKFVIAKLVRWLRGLGDNYAKLRSELDTEAEAFFSMAKAVHDDKLYNIRLRSPGWDKGLHGKLLPLLDQCTDAAAAILRQARREVPKSDKEGDSVARKIQEAAHASSVAASVRARLLNVVNLADQNLVYWIELTSAKNAIIKTKPIDVSAMLHEELFKKTRSSIMTSATLSTGGHFEFLRTELGVPDNTLQTIVSSPFNFTEQSLLVVPQDTPDTKDEFRFQQAVADAIAQVAQACGGRTLCLFTSIKNMKAVHELVRKRRLPYRLLLQGAEMQRMELYRAFREDESSLLFGVASFWTGVDVPGEALIGLVIDKLPFPNMSDPFNDAIKTKWKDSFKRYSLPRAIITLKQGIGRLIRRKDDYGVVVVADRRAVESSSYSRQFLLSLPPMSSSRSLADIPIFLKPHQERAVAKRAEGAKARVEKEIA
jgi:ATP-dependent DNA helicase DinG